MRDNSSCPCGCGLDIHIRLQVIITQLEKMYPSLYITSGARCREYNKFRGRDYFSYHQTRRAADITVSKEHLLCLYCTIIDQFPEIKGIGFYPDNNFIHIDLRLKEERALWGKLRTGGYITIDDAIKHYERTNE